MSRNSAPRKPAPAAGEPPAAAKVALHPRNKHQGAYDLARLARAWPALSRHLVPVTGGAMTLDFGDADAVRALNRALLKADYDLAHWDIPPGYLCPPIPGRADYLHGLADLLAVTNGGTVPRGARVRALDIGVGANCIYPLIGHREYGWRFVGSEVDDVALEAARANVHANGLDALVELRRQSARGSVLAGLLDSEERFDVSLCNPPFHASAEEAARGSQRKWRNLGRQGDGRGPSLNFGGQPSELWCTGGEASFLRRMIRDSAGVAHQVLWFSSLVAKSTHLAGIQRQLRKAGAREVRVCPMAQGSKQSRFVAWTFLDEHQRDVWRSARWS